MSNKSYGLKHGYRSGLEEAISRQLTEAGVDFEYEKLKIKYQVNKTSTYTPDFKLPNGIIVETKGRFVVADRMKHLLIKEQHPELDIRFVFSNANVRLTKTSKTTYGQWADKHGFKWANKLIPPEWLGESLEKP